MVDRYIEVKPFMFDGEAPHIVRHGPTGLYLARVVVLGELGLHARPAMEFVERAAAYVTYVRKNDGTGIRVARLDDLGYVADCDHIVNEEGHIDGTSIMGVMLLAAKRGTHLGMSFTGNGHLNQERRRIGYFLRKLGPSFTRGL